MLWIPNKRNNVVFTYRAENKITTMQVHVCDPYADANVYRVHP